jgi:UDP-glucose:(heptosyl)LPS alpha-1,3-glucosyltransferase
LLHGIDPKHLSFRLLERKALFGFDSMIVVPSLMVGRHLQEHYDITGDRVHVVHNAIDPGRFQSHDRLLIRAQMRQRWDLLPEDPVGLFVGHNYRLKGLDSLLEAVRLIPPDVPFRLMVCGGRRYQAYQRKAERWGLSGRIGFLGYLPDVREAFFAADFLIHPSFYDPCALVTMEALACGLPVITTRLNGAWEKLPEPLSSLTIDSPHDHQAMARNIVTLCNHTRRAAFARAAREAAPSWTFEHHYQALMQVFHTVLRGKQPDHFQAVHRPGLVS